MAESCVHFNAGHCRSCPGLRDPSDLKESRLSAQISAHFPDVPIAPLFRPKTVFGSRTKAKLAVSGTVENPIVGLPANPRELLDCPLHHPLITSFVKDVPALIRENKLTPYNIESQKGELKGLILKVSASEVTMSVRFVLRSTEPIARLRKAVPKIQSQFPYCEVISANLHPTPSATLEGKNEILLTEKTYLVENYNGVSLRFSPQSFSQVTYESACELYGRFEKKLYEIKPSELWDLYCGVGGFSQVAAKFVPKVVGVELGESSVLDAKRTAPKGVHFVKADIEEFLKRTKNGVPSVIVNPPKRGLGPAICKELVRFSQKDLFYSSCNPETLIEDLKCLKEHYTIESLEPIDMFPLTHHLEVLAHLKRS